MNDNTKIKVNEVKSRPEKLQGYSMAMRGIRTREAAEAWGVKYGFPTVYWLKADEKVYGVREAAISGQLLAVSSEPLAEVQS